MREGVGCSVPRLEDERFLRGEGEFVADIRLPGMRELAFVRSPLAHALIRGIKKPAGAVFTAADLAGVAPIVANSALPGFRTSEQPVLAHERVRYVGEPIAACVAASRAEAEDLAAAVAVDFEELPAVVDMREALATPTRLHAHWPDNVFLETFVAVAPERFAAGAPITVRRRLRTARQCMSPLEGRGVVATWDRRLGQLLLYTATQMPHIVRTGLAGCLGLDEARIRVVSPDVGGGFGYKGILLAEEVCASFLARRLGHPVRWIEDRREQLAGNANCREHDYDITLYAEADGRLIGIDAEAVVDAGAYSAYPFSACLEAAQVASILPGPYVMESYRCRTFSAATNKPPILPYRGVARAGVCFAIELMMDALAREAGLDPLAVRLRNLVPAAAMPFDNITGKHFDSGDYPACLRRVAEAIDIPAVRRRQAEATGAERIGLGFSIFCEQGAHGTSVYAGWGIPMVPGFEQATAQAHAGRRARASRRRAFARARAGDDARADRARDSRDSARRDPARPRRYGDDALFHRHLGLALHRHGGRRGGERLHRACLAHRADRRASPPSRAGDGARRQRRRFERGRRGRDRRRRAHLVSPPAGPARRRSPGRPRGDRRLQDRARQRHLQLRRPRCGRRGGYRDRRGAHPRLRDLRGWRPARQPDDRGRPGARRRRARDRHRALRGDAVRPPGPAARHHARRLHAAGRRPRCQTSGSSTWKPLRRSRSSARRASARAARSARRRRSPTPSTTRSRPLGVAIAELPITPRRILAALLARRR